MTFKELEGRDNMEGHWLRNFFYEILETLDVGIHIIDEGGNTVFYNSAMGRLENLVPSNIIGKNLLDIFPSLTRETSTLIHVLNKGRPIIDRVQTYFNINGQEITTINSTYPLKKGNKVLGAMEIAKDITKLKQLSEKVIFLQDSTRKKVSREKLHPFTRFTFKDIIGESRQIKKAIDMAKKASGTSSSILLVGETGTGKELFAQSIHNGSNRRYKPFIAQNCAALPESLLEGIIFGTVKGGFTGAVNRPGLFEQADGGTLFLDEINSMGINLQAKLLRVLQEGVVRRLGDTKEIPVDVRILATANEDPIVSIKKGVLRQDLFYRIGVVYIKIPPLRDRKEDILPLTKFFIDKFNHRLSKNVKDISEDVKKLFMSYNWPGNVRELENTIEGSMNMVSDERYIEIEHLPLYIAEQFDRTNSNNDAVIKPKNDIPYENVNSLDIFLENLEKKIVLKTYNDTGGNITKTAQKLKIKRQTLQYKLKKYGIIS